MDERQIVYYYLCAMRAEERGCVKGEAEERDERGGVVGEKADG